MKHILIIEDELNIAELERDYLEIEGFQASIEQNGHLGLARALSENWDLIMVDLMLPGMDGFEICRTIRQSSGVPIIMISARSEDIDKIRGLGLGADDYITKPFSPVEMVARVKAHMSRYQRLVGSRQENHEDIKIKGLFINKAGHRVFLNGTELAFSAKEFDLLVYLASNPNIVLSKEQIYTRIWGEDAVGELTTVAVHVRKIREKIENDPSNPEYIETVWGAGYRFTSP